MLCDCQGGLWDFVEGNTRSGRSHVHHQPYENNADSGRENDLERRAMSMVMSTSI